MKKLLMLVLVMFIASATTLPCFAQDVEDECPCGTDEEGLCLPCDEE